MSKRDTVNFGPAVQMPPIDPRAASYAERIKERHAPPRYNQPVAGGAAPPIPRLDGMHQDRMTMADQAPRQQAAMPSIMEPQTNASPSGGLNHSDVLPEVARQDPHFQEGAGSMLAINQPNLAFKYGIIRQGKHLPPQQIATGRPGLSKQTVEGLEHVRKFNEERVAVESGDRKIEEDAAKGVAGAAARIAGGGDADVRASTKADQEATKKILEGMDDFEFNAFKKAVMKDLLNNDEQRKAIEARLEPLDLTELILRSKVTQVVPVIPGRFEPEFQSMSAEEDLALKRMIMEETKSFAVTEQYMLDKFSVMSVACGLYALNKKPIISHLDAQGNFDDDLFRKKYNTVTKFPFHLIASLGVHYYWFDIRVRKLFVVENLKNG